MRPGDECHVAIGVEDESAAIEDPVNGPGRHPEFDPGIPLGAGAKIEEQVGPVELAQADAVPAVRTGPGDVHRDVGGVAGRVIEDFVLADSGQINGDREATGVAGTRVDEVLVDGECARFDPAGCERKLGMAATATTASAIVASRKA